MNAFPLSQYCQGHVTWNIRLIFEQARAAPFPCALGATNPEHKIIEWLLEHWVTGGGRKHCLTCCSAFVFRVDEERTCERDPAFQTIWWILRKARIIKEGLRRDESVEVVVIIMRNRFWLRERDHSCKEVAPKVQGLEGC